jgi:hypothetical protein
VRDAAVEAERQRAASEKWRATQQELERAETAARYEAEENDRQDKKRLQLEERQRRYRLIGHSERMKHVAACYSEYAPIGCRERLLEMHDALAEADRAEFAAGHEKILQGVLDARHEPSLDALLCCDQTTSEKCACAGSIKGCCDGHGGVCGCAK